ncbi:MAG TPA: hypothetical protein VGC39_10165 [Candidatus Methylacidiphilales bacterium]
MGCLGCGCLILLILALLIAGLIGGVGYVAYSKINSLTSASPTTIQSYDGGDDLYHGATQKLTDFNQAVQQHKAATLHLNADEINTLIARDPDFKNNNIQVFVTMTDDVAEIKLSSSLNALNFSMLKNRYLSGSIKTGLDFDPQNKVLNFLLKSFQIGNESLPQADLPIFQSYIDSAFNQALQKNSTGPNIINQAKSIEIKNSELVIEVQ